MAVKAEMQPIVQPRSPGRALRQVLAPIGQLLVFVVGSCVVLGGIVALLAVVLQLAAQLRVQLHHPLALLVGR